MAFRRAEASSLGWPPDRNAIPGTAAGTARRRTCHRGVGHLVHGCLLGQAKPGSTMLGFRIMPSSSHPLRVKLVEDRSQHCLRHLAAALQGVLAVHEHFRLDDRDQSGFLAQRGIARQRLRVGLDAAPAGNAVAHGDDRAPLGEAGAHLRSTPQAVAQAVQAFGDLLAGMAGQVLGAGVDLDAGDDARLRSSDLDEGSAVSVSLADRLVVQDRAADALAETGRGHDQFPIGAPRLLGLGNPQRGKAPVAGGLLSSIASRPLSPATSACAVSDQRPARSSCGRPTSSRGSRACPGRAGRCSACARPACPASSASGRRPWRRAAAAGRSRPGPGGSGPARSAPACRRPW